MRIILILLSAIHLFCFFERVGWAAGRTDVLPRQVWSLSYLLGDLPRLTTYFDGQGDAYHLDTRYTFNLGSEELVRLNGEARHLREALNALGSERWGDQLELGQLRIEARPRLTYQVPILAFGVSERWTLAAALPVVHYRGQIMLRSKPPNIERIQAAVKGLSPEIDAGLARLAQVDLKTELINTLVEKDYLPLNSFDRYLIGDLQTLSLLQFPFGPWVRGQWKSVMTWPTGSPHDPRDLTDPDLFDRWAWTNEWIQDFHFTKVWTASASVAWKWPFPRTTQRRVAADQADEWLPGPETEQQVRRTGGHGAVMAGQVEAAVTHWMAVRLGVERTWQGEESFSGAQGRFTVPGHVLSRWVAGVDLSTVAAFFKGHLPIPASISYEMAETFAGRRTEDQTQHLLWMKVFYQ